MWAEVLTIVFAVLVVARCVLTPWTRRRHFRREGWKYL